MRVLVLIPAVFSFILQAIAAPFPFPSSPLWKSLGDTLHYHPDNLWEHNDGAADQYIKYGLRQCTVGEFKTSGISFTMEVYDMGNSLNAFGIYQVKSRGVQTRFSIGGESAVTLPSQCMMFKDKYFVLIYVFEGMLQKEQAESLLTITDRALPGLSQLPEEIKRLPVPGIIPGSAGFCRRNFLGTSDLNNCLFASYLDPSGEKFQYFIILPAEGETPAQTMKALGPAWQTRTGKGIQFKYRQIDGNRFAGVKLNKGTLSGVVSAGGPEILAQRLSALRTE